METNGRPKAVYTILEKPGDKAFWLRIGWAHLNRDGSINVNLDAFPINGKLQVREWVPREEQASRDRDPRAEPPPTPARPPQGEVAA